MVIKKYRNGLKFIETCKNERALDFYAGVFAGGTCMLSLWVLVVVLLK